MGVQFIMPAGFIISEHLSQVTVCTTRCLLLSIYSVVRLCQEGDWDFRSAKYLAFTWNLEQNRVYRILGMLVALGPCLTGLVLLCTPKNWESIFLEVRLVLNLMIIVHFVKMILIPRTPVHHFEMHSQFVEQVSFRRRWYTMFYYGNDRFGAYVVDALWRAQHGHLSRLRELLQDPSSADAVLEMMSSAQKEEDTSESDGYFTWQRKLDHSDEEG
eukprot:TRINITY_DN15794_c0_g1_i2.p1 TRINITY_DN15794_c0_g1~~TRINITY_DN15794_c0_g1_i2.p1  ORF type:complete len:215 (-),score=24.77 TRINITY_DN15794_c0_g1_i2:116-760(-)